MYIKKISSFYNKLPFIDLVVGLDSRYTSIYIF